MSETVRLPFKKAKKNSRCRVWPDQTVIISVRFPFRHTNRDFIFILGERYYVLPQILHDFVCNFMAKFVIGTPTFEKAKNKIEKYFNERRKQAKLKRKVGYRAESVQKPLENKIICFFLRDSRLNL